MAEDCKRGETQYNPCIPPLGVLRTFSLETKVEETEGPKHACNGCEKGIYEQRPSS